MIGQNAATLTWNGGEIRWAYHVAASVRSWTLTSGNGGRTLTGDIEAVDAFRVAQAPLRFTVPSKRWSWPIESLQIADGRFTARLGPQE